jgi:hypothetical protein
MTVANLRGGKVTSKYGSKPFEWDGFGKYDEVCASLDNMLDDYEFSAICGGCSCDWK